MTDLETAIFERLKTVIDPETNTDVVRMPEVPGVTSQEIAIEGYLMAEQLEKLINEEN